MAGILDYIFSPSNMALPRGGILDVIRNSQQAMPDQLGQGSGFPAVPQSADVPTPAARPADAPSGFAQVGDYSMPQFGPRELYQPQEARLPANAQPAAGQLRMPEPSTGDRLLAGFQSFANSRGLIPAIANGITGAITGERQDKPGQALAQANQTAQFLVSKGMDPSVAKTVVSNPSLMQAVLPQYMGIQKRTDDINEFEFAKRNDGFKGTFEQWMQRKRGGAGEFGLQPVWGVDGEGNPAIVQLGKSGESVQSKLPEGFKIAKDPIKFDAGTHFVLLDPQTRQPIGTVPKDLAGAEIAKTEGEARGKARVELPGGVKDAQETIKKIDQLLGNEGFSSIFGPLDQFRPSWTMGDSGRDALARYKQLTGTAFLQAYGMLRGGGAITEIEGEKAQNAMARLDRAQSEEEARIALTDFKDAVRVGLEKLHARAGVPMPSGITAPAAGATAPTGAAPDPLNLRGGR
jgi:hypothetical protein